MKHTRWFAMSAVVLSLLACGGGGSGGGEPSLASLVRLREAAAAPTSVPAGTLLTKSLGASAQSMARLSSPASTSARAFFDWAQRTYPSFFPGLQADRTLATFVYRYYPGTETYLAVSDDTVFVMGPITNNYVVALGKLADYADRVSPPGSAFLAEPVGMQCAAVQGEETCSPPTSSKGSKTQILAMLDDAQGARLRFTVFGYEFDYNTLIRPDGSEEGHASYGSSEEELLVSASKAQFKGKTYPFSAINAQSQTRGYCIKATDCVNINPDAPFGGGSGNLMALTLSDLTASTDPSEGIAGLTRVWVGDFGLLSDYADAAVPTSGTIRYVGSVLFRGGDGSSLGNHLFNGGLAGCAIELTLNPANGQITSPNLACIGSGSGETSTGVGQLSLALPLLSLEQSKVRTVQLGAAATGSAKVKLEASDQQVLSDVPTFRLDKIAGGVYGTKAATLAIIASGPQGVLSIHAERQ